MVRLATFIVDKRKAFMLLFIVFIVYSLVSMGKVKVNNDLTVYLPQTTQTRIGLNLMNEQFVTYGTARIVVSNVTYDRAFELAELVRGLEGVSMVDFDDTEDYYHDCEALLSVTFDGEAEDPLTIEHLDGVLDALSDYDTYLSSDIGQEERNAADLDSDMLVIMLLAAVVVVVVLFFTSETFGEIPVYLITFIVAAVLNMGTNCWFGTISFVTNSIAVILQLALGVDYAIIFCNRFRAERADKEAREAVIAALSKAIPEISSSSLTTVSGMVALMFMQFKIGFDMGIVLAKAIVLSLLTVFFLMPGLLMIFARAIDRTHHKSFVPKITAIGWFDVKTRFIIPPVFVALLVVAYIFSSRIGYVFDVGSLKSSRMSDNAASAQFVEDEFGTSNQLAVMVPRGDYASERKILNELDGKSYIKSSMGLVNIEAMDGYMLADELTPRDFAEMLDIDVELVEAVYTAYAIDHSQYGSLLSGVSSYKVPFIDLFLFIYDEKTGGNITLDADTEETLEDAHRMIMVAQNQLVGPEYDRMVLFLSVPNEGEETTAALDDIKAVVGKYYTEMYFAGNSTSDVDLANSFARDNTVISVLTALFVMIILLFTFKSAGLPVLLVLTIEGSIWINFSIPYLANSPQYFLGYLVVSSIQMGATIDYAIVITSHYMDLKSQGMSIKTAIVQALNEAFPTIVTSGTMMTAAGFIINAMSSNAIVAGIGLALGRGTLTSIALVLLCLPQTLLLGDIIIEKTAFTLHRDITKPLPTAGRVWMNGHIKGYVNGVIDGEFTGTIDGEMGAVIRVKDEYRAEIRESEALIEEREEIVDEAKEV